MTQDKNIHIEHDTALITDNGGIVCNQVCSPEWAEYIVRAVNNHYQLVEAIEHLLLSDSDMATNQARQALSNAKGE